MLAGCAGAGQARDEAGPPEAAAADTDEPLLDRTRQAVFAAVNNTSRWVDGFFGGSEVDERPNVSQGRLNLGAQWDERDGIKNRVRLKARIPMPALEERARLIVGRGDADDFVDGSDSDVIDRLPDRFNDFEDDDWFLGLGLSRDGGLSRGFNVGVGASVSSSSIDPYVNLTYRWNRSFGDDTLLRLRPLVFWQDGRGTGASLTGILDYVAGPSWLLRSWNFLTFEEAVEGTGWTGKLSAYQSLARNRVLSYSLYATGETDNEVPLKDYGIELRYRRLVYKDWLYLELSTSVGWPREFLEDTRDSNVGVGIEFEMQFGEWPYRRQQQAGS